MARDPLFVDFLRHAGPAFSVPLISAWSFFADFARNGKEAQPYHGLTI
jgi:hypothetical protein